MMTKYKVGDKVRVVNVGAIAAGSAYYHNGFITEVVSHTTRGNPRLLSVEGEHGVCITPSEIHAIERITDKPKKSERISALETQVAELQAKVDALEATAKFPNTARFERESAEMDGILADIKRKARTPNEQRADVIKRAKAFVAEHTQKNALSGGIEGVEFGRHVCDVEFIVNKEKRVVTLLAKGVNSGTVHTKGIAKCDPDDVFNADIGKAIALARALGVEVPAEFVKAVQPTEVVVGHVIQSDVAYTTLHEVSRKGEDRVYVGGSEYYFLNSDFPHDYRIANDTDAVYE